DIDKEKMDEAEAKAVKGIKLIYIINPLIEEGVMQRLEAFFSNVEESKTLEESLGIDEKVKKLERLSDLSLSTGTYASLIREKNALSVKEGILKMVRRYLKDGVLSASDKASLLKEGIDTISIVNSIDSAERESAVRDLYTLDDLWSKGDSLFIEGIPKEAQIRGASIEIMKALMASNLQYSNEQTEKRRQEVLDKVPKIYKQAVVKKNEILIGKGAKVGKKHLKMLLQLEKMREIGGRFFYLVGIALLLVIFLVITILHLRFYESKIFHDNKNLLLISMSILFIVITAQAITNSPLSSYMIPLASASMLIAILLDANSAFIFTVVIAIFIGVITGNNFGLMVVMFIGSSVAIYSVRKVRRRSKLLIAGCLVGAANACTITALNFLNNIEPQHFIPEAGLGMLNGILSFFLAYGFLPILEYIFKIPTDITLLELSDLNHALLKEMATKAPGTYHHSLIVGNLAENASDAIGANTLLARVGAYYHDIGKIEKAEYFSENEGEPKNSRHENLTPSMSALIIINHVKDGIDLARKHKLNQALINFIAQHHGNGLIYYFYQRALERVENENDIKEEAFRYPGPRPQSKEAAIVLLADSVEASSRTLTNPTPSRVQGLVQRITNNKFIDGQLDECDLTLKDLHKISEAFVRILNAMFHTRVEYPNEEEKDKSRGLKSDGNKPDQKANPRDPLNKKNNKKSF
ncbi:MAG: HDIG domain-containing metalloprotein, partial [Candidatus Omnitrophota bacterium]